MKIYSHFISSGRQLHLQHSKAFHSKMGTFYNLMRLIIIMIMEDLGLKRITFRFPNIPNLYLILGNRNKFDFYETLASLKIFSLGKFGIDLHSWRCLRIQGILKLMLANYNTKSFGNFWVRMYIIIIGSSITSVLQSQTAS